MRGMHDFENLRRDQEKVGAPSGFFMERMSLQLCISTAKFGRLL
jgi:hypothetical protein